MDSKYYLKYLKYKKKYLELKGGSSTIDCMGQPMMMRTVTNPFGYSEFNLENLYKHFGNCFNTERFSNFLEIARLNNVTVKDMINSGFGYHQIIVSQIDKEDKIYEEVWEGHKEIYNNNKYFFIRAIGQGYLRLLAKNEASPIFDDAAFMVDLATESFIYKARKEPFGPQLLTLASQILMTVQNVKDSKDKRAIDFLDIFYSALEEFNISKDDLQKMMNSN